RPPPPSPRSSWPAVPPHGWAAPTRPACPSPARARWSASCAPPPSGGASWWAPAARTATCSPSATAPASCSRTLRVRGRWPPSRAVSPSSPRAPTRRSCWCSAGTCRCCARRPSALAASSSRSGAVTALEAEDGHLSSLAAAWPLGRRREALAAIERPGGGWADLSLRRLYAQLAEAELATLPATGAEGADIDTPDALAQVRRVAGPRIALA